MHVASSAKHIAVIAAAAALQQHQHNIPLNFRCMVYKCHTQFASSV
jgi:hypothetical protein